MSKKLINKSKKVVKKTTKKPAKKMKESILSSVTPELLMEWMESKFLTEVEFENHDFHFRASKNSASSFQQPSSFPVQSTSVPSVTPPKDAPLEKSNLKKILSPFVGTFYRSASPEADPFVKEGSRVNKGDTLCIIEAMKLMNEIESEIHGRITSVLIENGQPVEFGEVLFLVDPDL